MFDFSKSVLPKTCWIKSVDDLAENTIEREFKAFFNCFFTPKMLNKEQKEKYAEMARQWKATKSEVAEKVNRRMKYLKPVNMLTFKHS